MVTVATDVEGIFRLSGSEKRIKEVRTAFNTPERYGKGLDWTGYTVHDAANILRRYFNQLPEPIIPLEFYERFRDPLRAYQAQGGDPAESSAMENAEHGKAVTAYQKLITELPPLNRQLLLYLLDLLAVFASKSDLNRMTAEGARTLRADTDTAPVATPKLVQGAVEDSNVDPVRETTRMMDDLRSFQFTSEFIQSEADRMQSAIDKLTGGKA